ncbi:HypC/HybG/HupF family hydrogenase formation chaperone [Nannocystis bainbridge]|uniref:HypC/HybG/HupF family hydrogenase formation chaperone n=1 Tax=Nannocystis bainbridge TaxID=2995303 RepID=A0ABT5E7I0_9BACT|nr:HypC/HybG/HupF family hydrogenase formation chaperone [Nannocystis bainbridge]MDC0720858.1 HypC/HybG/HupF family hydrogenase formation chaperone [Nannocystis bainbridge]
MLSIASDELRMGRVSFGGVVKEVSLVYAPEAAEGDFVIVHAGFAIGLIDAAAAARVFAYLDALGEVLPEEPHP